MRILLVMALLVPSTGCFVRSHPRDRTVYRESRGRSSCPPAHHWDGGRCVHNGKAKGHYK